MAATIFFVMIISGVFQVVIATGTFDGLTMAVARKLQGREKLIIPIIMVLFSLLCTTLLRDGSNVVEKGFFRS